MRTLEAQPHALVVGGAGVDRYGRAKKNGPWRTQNPHLTNVEVVMETGSKPPSEFIGEFIGGNGANTARGLARLGDGATLYTHLGQDSATYLIKEQMRQEGVNLGPTEIFPTETTDNSFVILYESDKPIDRIIMPFKGKMKRDFEPQKLEGETFDLMYITSVGGEVEEWSNVYQKAMHYAKETATTVAVSPGSRQLHNKNETLYQTIKASSILLVNKEEAIDLLRGRDIRTKSEDIEDIMLALRELGPKMFSVTDGGKGSYFMTEDERIHKLDPFRTTLVDTTGAGDAYVAGVLSGLMEGEPIEEIMRLGTANASAVLTQYGAGEGLLTRKQMEETLTEHATIQPEVIYEPKHFWPIQPTPSK